MALDDLLDEHEQSERVRSWLRRNGIGLIAGVILGLAIIGGWQWWQKYQQTQQIQASERYQAALQQIKANGPRQAQLQLAGLRHDTYATLAALDLAKAQLDAGQRDAAIATLRAAKAADPVLQDVVRQRLARLLIDAGQAEQALQLLPAQATDAQTLEVRGDAQLALGQREQARAAYAQALLKREVGSPQRRLLELKLSEVGGSAGNPEPKA